MPMQVAVYSVCCRGASTSMWRFKWQFLEVAIAAFLMVGFGGVDGSVVVNPYDRKDCSMLR